MAGNNNSYGGNRRSNYGGNTNTGRTNTAAVAPVAATGTATAETSDRTEPILEQFVSTSKTGKSLTFYIGEKGLSIPAKSRAVIFPLTEKQIAGLKRVRQEKGYDVSNIPTHKLSVFKVEDK